MTAFSMPMLFSMLFSSYPFLVGEVAGIDILYKLFGIDSRKVVSGGYLLAFFLFIIAILVGFLFTLVFSLFYNGLPVQDLLGMSVANFVICAMSINLSNQWYFAREF